jgi:hypothetical protein
MHDIATGFWVPNSVDTGAGFYSGFGATINVLNGAVECGHSDDRANYRTSYYQSLMAYFGVSTSGETLNCSSQANQFVQGGNGTVYVNFD